MTEEQTLTQEPVAAIASPWRDGTAEGEKSADMFDRVITRLLHNAPEDIHTIEDRGAGYYIDTVVIAHQMQTRHVDYLLAALNDGDVLDLAERLAARVRLVAEPFRAAV